MSKILIHISVLLLVGRWGVAHECVHDEMFSFDDYHEIDTYPTVSHNRILISSPTTHPIRIHIDYSRAEQFTKSNPDFLLHYQMSSRILDNAKRLLERLLNVTNFNEYIFPAKGSCRGIEVPPFNLDIDLYVIVQPENDPGPYHFAAAGSCAYSKVDGRPVMGVMYLNFAKFKVGKLHEYHYFSTFLHEFTHLLGFTINHFRSYINKETRSPLGYNNVVKKIMFDGKEFDSIILPDVVKFAREYYGCMDIEGVPLEDGGGSGNKGSHWEKSFFPNEYMNPIVEYPGVISGFTLALLKGTGWYDVFNRIIISG